jgi:Fe-S-cluster-containing hydrogenase component 2
MKMLNKISRRKFVAIGISVFTTLIGIIDSCSKLTNHLVYQVKNSVCIGCKKCISVCPVYAIDLVNGKAVIDGGECIGCGRCAQVCSANAISSSSSENSIVK